MRSWRYTNWAIVLLLALSIGWTGCDSSDEDDVSDAERFVGNWEAVSATAAGVDLLTLLDGSLSASYPTSTTFTLAASNGDGDPLLDVAGTFTVDEAANTITYASDEITRSVAMGYQFENNNNTVVFTFDGSAFDDLGFEVNEQVLNIISGQTVTATLTRR